MAAGLPVVATDVGGMGEVVDHERTGVLIPSNNPRALADAICALIAAPERARTLAANGRHAVEERFGFDRMVASIEHLYESELIRRTPELAVQSRLASL
jgi:glycosyltransferase involved in cell wall biosynthesis